VADLYYGGAAFSPDGGRICYQGLEVGGGQVHFVWRVIEAESRRRIVTLRLPQEASDIHWSPDGKALTFLDRPEGALNVLRQRLDGGEPEQVTHFTTGQIIGHSWAQDGNRLAFIRRIEDRENLWTAADGRDPVQLTHFETGRIFDVKLTKDGGDAVFTYGSETQDVVLIRGFR
jgi:Tol biopolymer transport system component